MADATRPIKAAALEAGIPPTQGEREHLRAAAAGLVRAAGLTPPLPVDHLRELGGRLLAELALPASWLGFAMVQINNAAWRNGFAGIPAASRLLLLPQCLRQPLSCQAEYDEYGLICANCGACPIGALEQLAEQLGYESLVAEASGAVEELIDSGRIEAVVGVSCLEALEKTIERVCDQAIPSLALPLLRAGCADTAIDPGWAEELLAIGLNPKTPAAAPPPLFGIAEGRDLHRQVDSWFTPDSLRQWLGDRAAAERLAVDWVARDGKRWRPFLVVATCRALRGPLAAAELDTLRPLALAVECFHKASLIHDDIEDGDDRRYDAPSLHAEHGIPIALNVGDLLIGEGYRLLAETALPATTVRSLVATVASAQRRLCLGQAAEFEMLSRPQPPTVAELLAGFELKTAPAFEAALLIGALAADADQRTIDGLRAYSRAVGVGYQIRDDLADFELADALDPRLAQTVLAARLFELEPDAGQAFWHHRGKTATRRLLATLRDHQLPGWGQALLDDYRRAALATLADLDCPALKQLLFRVAGRIIRGKRVT